MDLTVLDYSRYGNEADLDSDARIVATLRGAGHGGRAVRLDGGPVPAALKERLWIRHDLRSRPDLRWIVDLADRLARCGHTVFPPARSILLAEDKWETFLALRKASIPTVPSWPGREVRRKSGSVVLKTRVGWGGIGTCRVDDPAAFVAPPALDLDDHVVQPFIPHERTWTVAVAGDAPVACIEKSRGEGDFRTDGLHGGPIRRIAPPPDLVALARRALLAVGLVTATVDLIEREGRTEVLEINASPCLHYPYLPDVDLAGPMVRCVMAWMEGPP